MDTQIAAPAQSASATPLGLGLVGCGGFGRFCLEAYRAVPGLRLVAASDNDPGRLQATAADFGVQPYADYEALLADPAVQIVAINTPPSLHGCPTASRRCACRGRVPPRDGAVVRRPRPGGHGRGGGAGPPAHRGRRRRAR